MHFMSVLCKSTVQLQLHSVAVRSELACAEEADRGA